MIHLNSVLVFNLLAAGHAQAAATCPMPEYIDFQVESVIERTPKDSLGFTEGLEFRDGALYESTGTYGGSTAKINRISLSGEVQTIVDHKEDVLNGEKVFGEGMTTINGKTYQLTYKNGVAFVYDAKGRLLRTQPSPLKEGWGLTNDGKRLISSDGSATLKFHNPDDLTKFTSINVKDENGSVENLNELEYVNGKVYANIFGTNDIVRIDPVSGCVEARADMTNLKRQIPKDVKNPLGRDHNFVLNGIAFDSQNEKFYLTGKNWPVVFKARMVKIAAPKKPVGPPGAGGGCDPSQGPCGSGALNKSKNGGQ